jgi:excisionase family DNA binding protein
MSCPDLLRVADAAKVCNVSRFAIHRWITVGVRGVRLAATMMGGTWRISRADLDAFTQTLTRQRVPAEAGPSPGRRMTPTATRQRASSEREILRRMGC